METSKETKNENITSVEKSAGNNGSVIPQGSWEEVVGIKRDA